MSKEYQCPCCGEYTLDSPSGEFDICSNCGWEDDDLQKTEPDLAGGANDMSLNEARKAYKEGRKVK